jgi:hypothetical protein
LCFELVGSLDLELHAAKLDQIARLERPHLAGQQPLAIHEGAAGALQIADTERFTSEREAGVSAGHAPGRIRLLVGQVKARSAGERIAERGLTGGDLVAPAYVAAADDLEDPAIAC